MMKALHGAGVLLLLGVLLVLLVELASPFWGEVTQREVCVDCGQVRSNQGTWVSRWRWIRERGVPRTTPVSEVLAAGSCAGHRWRFFSESRHYGALLRVTIGRSTVPERVLSEERLLGELAPDLAREAVRARLADPRFDAWVGRPKEPGTEDAKAPELKVPPPWFSAPGWPPKSAEEARAWWKGARP